MATKIKKKTFESIKTFLFHFWLEKPEILNLTLKTEPDVRIFEMSLLISLKYVLEEFITSFSKFG